MNKGFELVRIRADDYLADLLDREASLMPPGFEDTAEILRQQAKYFRESARTEILMIWKQLTEK
jgi:hypothetical protein